MNKWMAENLEIVKQIEKAYADERYTDIDGTVWVGRGDAPDEVWIVESGSDEGYMTKDEMLKKMTNELSGTEQYRRDEAVRIEALIELAETLDSARQQANAINGANGTIYQSITTPLISVLDSLVPVDATGYDAYEFIIEDGLSVRDALKKAGK